MQKLFCLAGLLASVAGPALAQTPGPAAPAPTAGAATPPGPYCTVSGYTSRNSFTKMSFTLDYGDNAPAPLGSQRLLEQQRVEALHSVADLLNYMAGQGWELSSTVGAPTTGLYFFILRRRATL